MFGFHRKSSTPTATAGAIPMLGGVAGFVLQNVLARRLVPRFAGVIGGGLPGLLVGAAATYALDKYVFNRQPARR